MILKAVLLLVVLPLATFGQTCPAECTSCDSGIANCLGTGIRDIPRNFPNTVTTMDLSSNQLTELSSSSFQELTSLQTLRMSGNGISEVLDRSFKSLPSLMSIDLSNNPIVFIQDKAFDGLAHLRLLSITSTRISRIGRSLNGLDSLHTINMVSNQIESLEDENFELSTNLRMIDLSQNQITRISPKTFANLKLLRYLSLSSNPIVRVPELQFGSNILQLVDFTNCLLEDVPGKMPASVADFRLGNNKLTEIKAEHFENITNLHLITLNNNQITKVDDKAFGYLDRLMEIWLSNNQLKSIPRLLPRNIHKLFLDHNGIYEIAQRNFAINSQLEVLSLDTNRVERIAEGAWDEMPKLRSVNLNANNLQVLTPGAFVNIPSLECLKLSNNPLKLIEKDAMKDLPKLNEISLSYFQTTTTQLNRDFIQAISNAENVNMMNSPGLVKSFLKLVQQPNSEVMEKTSILALQYNELESLPENLKRTLPNVKKLFLDGNPLYCDSTLKWLQEWMKRSDDISFYNIDPPVCAAPKEIEGRELTSLDNSEFVKPREITQQSDTQELVVSVSRGDLAQPKNTQDNSSPDIKPTKLKKKKKKKNKKNKNKKNKKRKNKKNRKGKKKRDRSRIKRRHKRCVVDASGKKICPRRQRRCTVGPDGKRICKRKNKKGKKNQVSSPIPVLQG
ncbi:slit homolog 2 protein-like [Mytilus californianus]|uniref:slit homolog 2 protein-like n=1 Tax=Mytilus californianus TaxID=6549 RepID=UPI0022480AF1|nr:slit homolog 2 protein-like [Mytilus californianus]